MCNSKKDLIEYLNNEYELSTVLVLSVITLKENFINLRIQEQEENGDQDTQSAEETT